MFPPESLETLLGETLLRWTQLVCMKRWTDIIQRDTLVVATALSRLIVRSANGRSFDPCLKIRQY
jgi:hypothetical protein